MEEENQDIVLTEEASPLSVEEAAALASSQTALVEYVPKSQAPYRMNTLIPRNMAFEVQKALSRIVKREGNIDNYVRNHLKYTSTEELWKGLGAEQVDAVAMYLTQFDKEQGVIIADQTGIGKGRQAAAVIRHAIMNGYLPVFFTRKPDLFTDMYRDLKSIGFAGIHPFIINTDTDARIKDSDGHVVFSPLSQKHQYELLNHERTVPTESPASIQYHKRINKPLPDPEKYPTVTLVEPIDYLPSDYDCIFCTYSQVQAAQPYKRMWLSELVARGVEGSKKHKKVVFILDESHMAGGFDSIVGTWMRKVLPKTKACCFLSATFAKYPEVMPFYSKKTAIQEANMSDFDFVSSMQRGGLALQEIVASNLAESGQLIRRQRSGEGIRVEYKVLDQEPERSKNRASVDRITRLMNQVVEFEERYIVPVLNEIHEDARKAGEYMDVKPKSLGVKQAPYFSRVFNIIDQMLFSLKVEEVAKETLRLLNENKKVVIAFKSTMGSFLKDLNLVSGDIIHPEQMDFTRTLTKGLESIFHYSYTSIDGKKERRRVFLEDIPRIGQEMYHQIKEAMMAESTGLTISPIDKLMHIIQGSQKSSALGGHNGDTFRVAEVTGRNQRIRFENGEAIIEAFRSDTEKAFRLFNRGDYDVLLINQSGSTGSSAHASSDYKDQRVRTMIIHQFELDINTEVQKRGRINRTGQVVLPEYYYVTSDIPTEKRLMTMLKGKLKSLDANTTGSQKTNDDTLKSPDFFNKYGDAVAWEWVNENQELVEKMGWPTYHRVLGKYGEVTFVRNEGKDGSIKQVTGRAGLLSVEEQDKLYNDLLNRYDHRIRWEKERGTYDLETEFLKLDAKVEKKYLFQKGKGGNTPFGKHTVREVCIVNNLRKPLTRDEVDKLIARHLDGKRPKQAQTELINEVREQHEKTLEERRLKRLVVIEKLQKEYDELPATGGDDDDDQKLERQKARLKAMIGEKNKSLDAYLEDLEKTRDTIMEAIGLWEIGQVVKIPIRGSFGHSLGIFSGISIDRSKDNPYTPGNVSFLFAVTDFRALLEYNLVPASLNDIKSIYAESKNISDEDIATVTERWNEVIKSASQARERRHILTENLVAASSMIGPGNRLIKYNTTEGLIRNGVFMAPGIGPQTDISSVLPISDAYERIREFHEGQSFWDAQERIRLTKISGNYFQVFIQKKGNFQLHTDEKLRQLIKRADGQSEDELPDFVQNAGEMTAALHLDNLEAFLKQLDEHGIKYQGEARELEDWEIENEEDWKKKTARPDGVYTYKLMRPYGQGSNPAGGFLEYKEPSPHYPFGLVLYSRPLLDKEKYNYSLIPVFESASEPYRQWKAATEATPFYKEVLKVVSEAKKQDMEEVILTLGHLVMNNAHEDGNPEFVWGDFSAYDLGMVAYEDLIKPISPLDELIMQLKIELEQ
ncbi:hypothetical protein GCM10009122_22770 [Fulvivirga kasyanovii]|uniref:Helicase n=1 Tax=Fulvivirga kasyanovii TaxID=396812 RepID=A0ABW9RSK8_9BACT|nr:strawberry notch C-terminal domain-containing protein [Fulvivirga kasyanovii]MTI26299.1 helicase [Fulvivirga kasyanovii]